MTKAPDVDDQDVPSPIDLRDAGDAAAWTATVDVKRPWRARLQTAIAELMRDAMPAALAHPRARPGPGLLAEAILDVCRSSTTRSWDCSAPMLEMCRQRVGDRAAVRFVLGDFTRDAWTDALDPPFDAVVAMQAVHEVRHQRHVPRLYAQLRALLRPGGMLVVCDHAPPDDSARLTAPYSTEHDHANSS